MALLHGGSLVLPDGISYHTPLQSISKFEEDNRFIKSKINNEYHNLQRNKALKKIVLKNNSLSMLSNAGNNNVWNLKENSNKENYLTCTSPTKSSDTTVSSARSTILSAQDFAPDKFSLIREHSNSDMLLNYEKSREYNFSNFRVDLERELAQEVVEEDEEDESFYEVSASPYRHHNRLSKVCGSANNCYSSTKPKAISAASNLSLKKEETLKKNSSTQKKIHAATTDVGLDYLKRKRTYLSNISSSLSKTSTADASSLSTVAFSSKDDSVFDNRGFLNNQTTASMLLTHSACSFENSTKSKPCYLSPDSFYYPTLVTDVNNLAVVSTHVNINQSHVLVRLQDDQMMLYQTLNRNNFNNESEQLVSNYFLSSSAPTSEAVMKDSDMEFSLTNHAQPALFSKAESKQKKLSLQKNTKQIFEKETLRDSKLVADISNNSASKVIDFRKVSGSQSLSSLEESAAADITCIAATHLALNNSEILQNPHEHKAKPDLATETPGLTLLKDASAALCLLPKAKCSGAMTQNASPFIFDSTSKSGLQSSCQAILQSTCQSMLQTSTTSLRSRSPSVSLHCTAYNTRSKRNSIRSDGGVKVYPKILNATCSRYKDDTDDDCNIYKKTYKTYSVLKNSFTGLTDSLCKILPSADDLQKFQMSNFIKSSRYGINSSLLMELGLLNSKPVKINPYLSRELTYDIGIQPIKKRCNAAWDSISYVSSYAFPPDSEISEELKYLPNSVVGASSIADNALVEHRVEKKEHSSGSTEEKEKPYNGFRTKMQQQYVLVDGCDSECKKRQIGSSNLPLKGNASSTLKNCTLQYFPNQNFPKNVPNSSCMSDVKLDTLNSVCDVQKNPFCLPHSSGCDRSSVTSAIPTATNNNAASSTPTLKLQFDLKMHKKAKKLSNEGSLEKNMNSLEMKAQVTSSSNNNAVDGFRRRKYRGKKTNTNGSSKCSVVMLEESCGNVSREADNNNVSLPPARGVWFDSKRNLWRASWRENGSLRTKGFSIGDLGLHEARIQAVAYRIARVPDMEIPSDLIGILRQNSDKTTAVQSSISSSWDLKSRNEHCSNKINQCAKACVQLASPSLLPSFNKSFEINEKSKEDDVATFNLSKSFNKNNFIDMNNIIGASKNNNSQVVKNYELNEHLQCNESRSKEYTECEPHKKKNFGD